MTVVADAARFVEVGARLRAKWYFAGIFIGLPVWWLLGLELFVWPLLMLPLGVVLVARGRLSMPRSFALWVLFLLWALLSATQLESGDRALAFVWRGSLYVAAAILFLYVVNTDRKTLPTQLVVNVMVGLCAVVVAGGYIGLLFPHARLTTPAAYLVPASLEDSRFIQDAVHADFGSHLWLGDHARHRPTAPFRYANEWGSTLALLVPFVLLAIALARSRGRVALLVGLLVAADIPLLASGNRGAWLALAVALTYVGIRLAVARRTRPLLLLGATVSLTVALAFATGLNEVGGKRLHADSSTRDRTELSQEGIERVRDAPLLGYGAPAPSTSDDLPSVGTHGQLLLVLVSHGIPAALLFFGWFGYAALRFRRLGQPVSFWAHVAVLIFLVESLFYELLPLQLLLTMVLLALAWRDSSAAEPQEQSA